MSALPVLPDGVHVAPPTASVWPSPVASAELFPAPSSKPYAATSPTAEVAAGVVAVAIPEYAPRFPAASSARTW